MKKVPTYVSLFRLSVALFLVGAGHLYSNPSDESISLSFDQLFPMSSGHQLIDTCLHMYEDLGLLKQVSAVPGYQSIVADAMLGKAARLDHILQRMLKQCRVAGFSGLHQDDTAYLMMLLDQIEAACIEMGVMNQKGSVPADPEILDAQAMFHTITLRLKQWGTFCE